MDVRLKPPGCATKLGTVLSLGLLPIVQRSQFRQFPASLDDRGMVLRNGIRIPWQSFTRFRSTGAYVNKTYINTTYELRHPGGTVRFLSNQVEDAEAVVAFILSRLPPEVIPRG